MAGILQGLGNVFGALSGAPGGALGLQAQAGGGQTATDYNTYYNVTTAGTNGYITIHTSYQQPQQEKPAPDPVREWLRRRVDEICWRA